MCISHLEVSSPARVVGDMSVGKSCLIKRYCESKFVARYIPTIGVDYGVRSVSISTRNNQTVTANVNFWDLSGDPSVSDIGQCFLNDAQCVLAVYDVGDRATFEHLEGWIKGTLFFSIAGSLMMMS